MAQTLSQVWIASTILKILDNSIKKNVLYKSMKFKTVQITKVLGDNMFEVSDSESTITLIVSDNRISIPRNAFVKLYEWHISTVMRSVNPDKIPKLLQQGVTMPFILRCDEVEVLGGDNCVILGDPTDVNLNAAIRAALVNVNAAIPVHKHALLVKQLSLVQFPDENCLPNAGM